ncbi:hypothetical protein AB3S75_036966 [Citrus x aurantiifolia]
MDPRTLTVESSMQVFWLDHWKKARWLDSILMRYPTKYQSRTDIPQGQISSLKVFLKAEENSSGTSGTFLGHLAALHYLIWIPNNAQLVLSRRSF